MRKVLALLMVLMLTLGLLAGCSTKSDSNDVATTEAAATTGEPAAKQYRVAYIARAQADSFAAWLANAVMEEADKYDNITLDIFDGQASDDIENGLIENAITKLKKKNLDLIVLNSLQDKGAGFKKETNKVTIIDKT